MKTVLVLNQDYTPLAVCSVRRAFLLVFPGKAEVLNAVKNKQLRSVSKAFPFPSVIKISKYVNVPYKGVVLSKQNIFKRDNHECQYCGSNQNLTLDHVIPRSGGGKYSWNNLVTACRSCNSSKGDRSPEEANITLKKQPKQPSYLSFLKTMNGVVRDEWYPYLDAKKFSMPC